MTQYYEHESSVSSDFEHERLVSAESLKTHTEAESSLSK